jgi:hypothetical protein
MWCRSRYWGQVSTRQERNEGGETSCECQLLPSMCRAQVLDAARPASCTYAGALMPSGSESQLRAGRVRIVVHPPIPTKGRDADQVCDEARVVIASAMPSQLVGSATIMAAEEE